MNEGLANGAGDFNVFSALNGDVNFQNLSSEIDDDATELNLVEAVASGEKIDTSFAEENEVEATEECLDAERRLEICQNVASAACDSCAAAGNCPILRMRNFAEENLRPATEELKSYLPDLMNDDCDFVVAGYVSADNEEKPSESIEKDSPSENEKTESVSEKPAVKLEVSDNDASIRMSAESNEVNKSTDDECLNNESELSENIPSTKIVKENIPLKINEGSDETEAANQINLVDSEYIDEKVDIHKEDVSSENQDPAVDKEDELPRELPIKKDNYIGDENNINSAPILEDSTPREGLAEKVISNELNSSPVRDFVQVNNEIDMAMKDDNNNAPVEMELNDETVHERVESVELIENSDNSPILPKRDFEERKVYFEEDSENVAVAEISDNRAVVGKTDNAVDDLGDRVELDEEGVCELEELPTNKSEIIGQFIPDLKLADDAIDQNNIVDEVVKKVAGKTELTEECRELVAADDLSDEKANYNCDEDDANNTNISGVYPGLWVDDSSLNLEDDKTSNSYGVNMFLPLVELLGFLAIKTSSIKQEIIIRQEWDIV